MRTGPDVESDPIQFGHVKHVSVEEIQNSADIISIHLPLKPDTVHYIDKKREEKLDCNQKVKRGTLPKTHSLFELIGESE